MIDGIPGLDMFFSAIDLSAWGGVIAGQVGYVIGAVLNVAIICALLWKFVLQPYVIYRYDVEITSRRGDNEVVKYDRGRIIRLKDGTEGFKLRKHKTIMDPLDFRYVINVKKPFTFGLVRVFQYSPRSYAFLKEKNAFDVKDWFKKKERDASKDSEFKYADSGLEQTGEYKKLSVIEQDKNRAIDMALKTEKKLSPPNAFTTYVLPLIGMGFIITVLVLLFLMADKGIQLGGAFEAAAAKLSSAIDTLNKCHVASAVGGS